MYFQKFICRYLKSVVNSWFDAVVYMTQVFNNFMNHPQTFSSPTNGCNACGVENIYLRESRAQTRAQRK